MHHIKKCIEAAAVTKLVHQVNELLGPGRLNAWNGKDSFESISGLDLVINVVVLLIVFLISLVFAHVWREVWTIQRDPLVKF